MNRTWVLSLFSYALLLCVLSGTGPGLSGPLQVGTVLIYDATWQFLVSVGLTLIAGVLSTTIAFAFGLPLGIAAALLHQNVRWTTSLPTDTLSCVPRYILILLLFSIFGKSAHVLIIGCALALTPVVTESTRRIITKHIANGRYEAFKAHGIGIPTIILRHFLGALGRRALFGEFVSGVILFFIVESSFAYIDPYVYSGLSTTVGMLVSRVIHGGHAMTLQSSIMLTGIAGLLMMALTLRKSLNVS